MKAISAFRYNPKDFGYPINEDMENVYKAYLTKDKAALFCAIDILYFSLKDLTTYKIMPANQVREIQDYFRGLLND